MSGCQSGMWITIIIFFILLLLSGFFSSAEIALMSLSRLQVERLVKQKRRNARTLAKLKEDPHKLLETILIGNNLVNITAAALATKLAMELFGNSGVGIATGVTTFFVLLFGEIIPKSLAVNHRKRLSLAISPFLYALRGVLTPIIIIIDALSSFFTRLFGEPEPERVTEEEVLDMVEASAADGALKPREEEMIRNVLEFDDTNVDEVMTPRLDVYSLEMRVKVKEVIAEALDRGFTRIPIYDRKMDNVRGVVNIKDLLRALHEGRGDAPLKSIMQPAFVVPETRKIDSLLREFQKRKNPFAIVVDEHGLFIGVITVEDILEELVGEIYDEGERAEEPVRKLAADTWLVLGKTPIDELNEKYGFSLPESDEYDTLAGYLLNLLGKVPREQRRVVDGKYEFLIEQVRQNRIEYVKILKSS